MVSAQTTPTGSESVMMPGMQIKELTARSIYRAMEISCRARAMTQKGTKLSHTSSVGIS
jgi:hypothetical protein